MTVSEQDLLYLGVTRHSGLVEATSAYLSELERQGVGFTERVALVTMLQRTDHTNLPTPVSRTEKQAARLAQAFKLADAPLTGTIEQRDAELDALLTAPL